MKIIIADDMEEYRNHFKMLLDNEHDITVVATANGKEDVIKKAIADKVKKSEEQNTKTDSHLITHEFGSAESEVCIK